MKEAERRKTQRVSTAKITVLSHCISADDGACESTCMQVRLRFVLLCLKTLRESKQIKNSYIATNKIEPHAREDNLMALQGLLSYRGANEAGRDFLGVLEYIHIKTL